MYIRYLNFPTVPEHLIEPLTDIVDGPFTVDAGYFKSRSVNNTLLLWLQTIFPFDLSATYQIISHELPIHKDVSVAINGHYCVDDRILAINYLLDAGGNNITTQVYEEDQRTILQSENIIEKQWHYLDVAKYHGVSGLPQKSNRISISVTVKNQTEVFRKLFNYIVVP